MIGREGRYERAPRVAPLAVLQKGGKRKSAGPPALTGPLHSPKRRVRPSWGCRERACSAVSELRDTESPWGRAHRQ